MRLWKSTKGSRWLFVVFVIIALIIQRCERNKPPEVVVRVERDTLIVVKDTTIYVDRAVPLPPFIKKIYISRSEGSKELGIGAEEADSIFSEIPKELIKGDSVVVNHYKQSFENEDVKALVTVNTTGIIVKPIEFEYTIKQKEIDVSDFVIYGTMDYSPYRNQVMIGLDADYKNFRFGYSTGIGNNDWEVSLGYKIKF